MYWFVRWLVVLVFRGIFRTRIKGSERVPATGGLLLVANHISYADPPLLGACLRRRIEFMAMTELFDVPFLGWLVRRLCAFPIDRSHADPRAVREAIRRLQAGACVGIFPEGGIRLGPHSVLGGDPQIRPGAAMIALLARVPILPVVIRDSDRVFYWLNWLRRAPMSVSIGAPFCLWLPPTLSARQRREAATQVLREQLLATARLD